MDHITVVCSLDKREIQHNVNNHITLLLCVFFLRLVYAADIYFGEDDQSQAAVNKITAHTGSYIPLIHHLLPAASCHTLSVLAAENLPSEKDFGEIKGKKKKKNSNGIFISNTLCGGNACPLYVTAANERPSPGDWGGHRERMTDWSGWLVFAATVTGGWG